MSGKGGEWKGMEWMGMGMGMVGVLWLQDVGWRI